MSISNISNDDCTILESKAIIKLLKLVDVNEQLDTAVLFLVFNRPDVTTKVFEAIRKAKPTRLYVAADGARADKQGEASKVNEVREIATCVDWKCEVKTLFRDENLGCKRAVSEGISWFFDHEEMGIILEDDCLPHQTFFSYCEELLERYKYDEKIALISGTTLSDESSLNESYYFSRYPHIWGWASWRRVWLKYDLEFNNLYKLKENNNFKKSFNNLQEYHYWINCFESVCSGKVNTWDYQMVYMSFIYSMLSIYPKKNQITNIGFSENATHTTNKYSPLANLKSDGLVFPLKHPIFFTINYEAECKRKKIESIGQGFINRSIRKIKIIFNYCKNIAMKS
jgi:hypothetical protein